MTERPIMTAEQEAAPPPVCYRCDSVDCCYELSRAEIERLRAALDRIGCHPHATGEIRRYAGDALGRVYNADGGKVEDGSG